MTPILLHIAYPTYLGLFLNFQEISVAEDQANKTIRHLIQKKPTILFFYSSSSKYFFA
jgi:hypothetical protein